MRLVWAQGHLHIILTTPTVMHLLDKPINVKAVTTVCSACGCIHRFNECSAFEACVVLLHRKPPVVKSLQAKLFLVALH